MALNIVVLPVPGGPYIRVSLEVIASLIANYYESENF